MTKNLRHNLFYAKGFTLLEVMVVLIIMAIITAVAMLSLHLFSHARQVTVTAQQLTQMFKVAETEAVLRPAVLGLRLTDDGFQFYEFKLDQHNHSHWKKLAGDKLSQPNAFHHLQVTLLKLNNQDINRFSEEAPYIVISPNGDVSPFSIMITDDNHDRAYTLNITEAGVIHLHELKHDEE